MHTVEEAETAVAMFSGYVSLLYFFFNVMLFLICAYFLT